MSDSLWDGRKIRLLNVIDDCNREVLWIETDTSLPAKRVIRVLQALKETRGLPKMIRLDNGPEFISHELDLWCKQNEITLVFIQPGKPTAKCWLNCTSNTPNSPALTARARIRAVRRKATTSNWPKNRKNSCVPSKSKHKKRFCVFPIFLMEQKFPGKISCRPCAIPSINCKRAPRTPASGCLPIMVFHSRPNGT